jgi:tRNA(adenine34) deaminase
MNNDEIYMKLAMEQAQIAANKGEVPVGAVIIRSDSGEVVAVGHNTRETSKNALCHAELDAINNCCRALGGWRLPRCTMYVTLEPCPMCAGAIVNSRIERVVYGAKDPKAGAYGSVFDMCAYPLKHIPTVVGGVLEEECADQLSSFFKILRKKKKSDKKD